MQPAVDIENISFTWEDGTEALSDIKLTIQHGEKLAVIGPNGAGKSTLLLAMNMFIKAAGKITIDGIDVCKKNEKKLRSIINLVLQNPDEQLFMPTLFEDVAFGPINAGLSHEEVSERTADAIKTVGLEGMDSKAPFHLSAGQKRAAAIATVLSMTPKIITMDEPDTSLDPRSRNNLVKLLKSLSQTLIIATCNMNFAARVCQRVVLVDGGRIIADGPAAAVMADEELMETHGLETPAVFKR